MTLKDAVAFFKQSVANVLNFVQLPNRAHMPQRRPKHSQHI
jgi:hypothetical protein